MPVILHCTPDGIECTTDNDSHMPNIDRHPPSETSKTLYFIIYRLTRAALTVRLILIIRRIMFVIHIVVPKAIQSSQYIQATI